MPAPVAYFLSWTTHGSWLPGDTRGWVQSGEPGIKPADPQKQREAADRMRGGPIGLNLTQRRLVKTTIREHCRIRGWVLHAVNPRTNHVHVVVTADVSPDQVMRQFKAWCSRKLNEAALRPQSPSLALRAGHDGKTKWWTEHGSTKWINNETYLRNAVHYVMELQ